jgi:hypothetical protein
VQPERPEPQRGPAEPGPEPGQPTARSPGRPEPHPRHRSTTEHSYCRPGRRRHKPGRRSNGAGDGDADGSSPEHTARSKQPERHKRPERKAPEREPHKEPGPHKERRPPERKAPGCNSCGSDAHADAPTDTDGSSWAHRPAHKRTGRKRPERHKGPAPHKERAPHKEHKPPERKAPGCSSCGNEHADAPKAADGSLPEQVNNKRREPHRQPERRHRLPPPG